MGKKTIFRAKVQALHRVVIPKPIREYLDIKQGDLVDITIEKVTENEQDRTESKE